MPAKTPKKSSGNFLKKKLGPAPVYVWVIGAVVVYLGYRYFTNSTASAATPATTPDASTLGATTGSAGDTGGASGGASAAPTGPDYTDLFNQLIATDTAIAGELAYFNASGFAGGTTAAAATGGMQPPDTSGEPHKPYPNQASQYGLSGVTAHASQPYALSHPYATSASTSNFAESAAAKTQAAKSAGAAAPYGGVVSTKTLKNGATLTTYKSGRQVEQAPGKSAYVVKA